MVRRGPKPASPDVVAEIDRMAQRRKETAFWERCRRMDEAGHLTFEQIVTAVRNQDEARVSDAKWIPPAVTAANERRAEFEAEWKKDRAFINRMNARRWTDAEIREAGQRLVAAVTTGRAARR